MFRSRIDLIGGGPGTLVSLRKHLKGSLSDVPSKGKPLVAYVGAASGDDVGFEKMIGKEIERAGGRYKGVKLASARSKLSAAKALLEGCDVIFVSGGDVEAGMNVLRERGAVSVLQALAREGKPIIGLSAGSIMLGRAWVSFPHESSAKAVPAKKFACLGIAPLYVDAHAEEDRWGELRVLLALCHEAGERTAVGYGLTRLGGIRVEAPTKRGGPVSIEAFGTAAPRFALKRGKVVMAAPLLLRAPKHPAPRRAARTR